MADSEDPEGLITVLGIYKLLPAIYFIILYYYRAYIFIFAEGYSLDLIGSMLICIY